MRKIGYYFLVVFSFFLINQEVFPQGKIQTTFDYSDGKILVFYEFQGDRSKDFEVTVKLKRTSDPSFEIIPSQLSGDIGEGKFAGKKNKITWVLNEGEESQLEGEDFYFDVTALELEQGGGIPWYIFAGGAALVGGTAAILLLTKKSSDEQTVIFPTPPGRP